MAPRLAGWLLICVYLLAIPGVGPVALGLLAQRQGGHRAQIESSGEHSALILHHDHGADSEPFSHENPLAFLGEDDDHADHVIGFKATCLFKDAPANAPKPSQDAGLLAAWNVDAYACAHLRTYKNVLHSGRPPPGRPQLSVCLRTTVLVV